MHKEKVSLRDSIFDSIRNRKRHAAETMGGDPARPAGTLIASYNVHKCVGSDGRFDPERISRVIHEIDAIARHLGTLTTDQMDVLFSVCEGWPGIRSPGAKDYLARHQITAEGWYVANPDLTVVETRRLERMGKATEEFLDKLS